MDNVTRNICLQCGTYYSPQRASSKFDSTKCRVAYCRDMKGRILIITQTKEDEIEMLRMFSDTKRRVVRKYTDTDTKFLIEYSYWNEITGLVPKKNNRNPVIINNVKKYHNKLIKQGLGGVTLK